MVKTEILKSVAVLGERAIPFEILRGGRLETKNKNVGGTFVMCLHQGLLADSLVGSPLPFDRSYESKLDYVRANPM